MSDRDAKVRQGRSKLRRTAAALPAPRPAAPCREDRPVVAVTGAAHDLGLRSPRGWRSPTGSAGSSPSTITAVTLTGVIWRVVDIRDPALAGRLAGIDVIVHTDLDLVPDSDPGRRRAYQRPRRTDRADRGRGRAGRPGRAGDERDGVRGQAGQSGAASTRPRRCAPSQTAASSGTALRSSISRSGRRGPIRGWRSPSCGPPRWSARASTPWSRGISRHLGCWP